MKLTAKAFPYSSIVGGGVMLLSEKGAATFQIGLRGTTAGISKEQTEAITARLVELINGHGLEVPDAAFDWPPRRSAVGLPEGERAHGSTGQLFEVKDGRWERVQ